MAKKKKGSPVSEESDNPKVLERAGQTCYEEGNFSGAIAHWNRLLKIRGGEKAAINRELLTRLGPAHYHCAQGQNLSLDKKLEHLKLACSYMPEMSSFVGSLLNHWRNRGEYEAAIAFCQEMIDQKKLPDLFRQLQTLLTIPSANPESAKELLNQFPGETAERWKVLGLLRNKQYGEGQHKLHQWPSPTAPTRLVLALAHLASGESKKAQEILAPLAQQTDIPLVSAFAHYYLGILGLEEGKTDEAIVELESVGPFFPQNSFLFHSKRKRRLAHLVAEIAFRKAQGGLLEEALPFWQDALTLVPADIVVEENLRLAGAMLAKRYAQEGQLAKAVVFWKKASEYDPDNTNICKNLAVAFQKLKDFGEAVRYWERTVTQWETNLSQDSSRIKPKLLLAYHQLAYCYGKLSRAEGVRRQYQRILELEPQNTKVKSYLAETYLEDGLIDNALSLLEELLQAEPNQVSHLTNMGLAYDRLGDVREAVGWWEKALIVDLHAMPARELFRDRCQFLIDHYLKQKKETKAITYLTKVIQYKPDDTRSRCFLGSIYLRQKKVESARECFEAALAFDPQNPYTQIHIGRTMLLHARDEEARKYFAAAETMASERYPLAKILYSLGLAQCCGLDQESRQSHCAAGRGCKAVRKCLDKAMSLSEEDLSLNIAFALQDQGCLETLYFVQKAHALHPENIRVSFLLCLALLQNLQLREFRRQAAKLKQMPDFQSTPQIHDQLQMMEEMGQAIAQGKLPGVLSRIDRDFDWGPTEHDDLNDEEEEDDAEEEDDLDEKDKYDGRYWENQP